MSLGDQGVVFLLAIALLATCAQNSEARVTCQNGVKSMVYLSPKITQHQGLVSDKYFYDIEFPKGHIAIKSFDAEVVDDAGNPVSLEETYLHHWLAIRYYERIGSKDKKRNGHLGGFEQPDIIVAGNAGTCDQNLREFFGFGAETRKTPSYIPDPYGLEVGDPLKVPSGYEEKWMFNIHAIDTRDTVDAKECAECRCDLYNTTKPSNPNYVGGVDCCIDGKRCKLKNGIEPVQRNVYLKYTVKWVDWSDSIVPVKAFIFDVTDTWQHTGIHDCLIEYDIEKSATGIATKRSRVKLPISGDVVYGSAHQHMGGLGSALYKEDGQLICSSKPIYGKGNGVGDEAGYVVGMTTCYPKPGSVKIAQGETITFESNYNSEERRFGVMGFFYILVAESPVKLAKV
ncbi:putative stress up-regulated Nod 19 [Helianthus debilis subsp. tardiflorus]